MREVHSFDASTRRALYLELASRQAPMVWRVLSQPSPALTGREVAFRTCAGRLCGIAASGLPAATALLRVALIDLGRVEVGGDSLVPADLDALPSFEALLQQAEGVAETIAAQFASLGPPSTIVHVEARRLSLAVEQLDQSELTLARQLIDRPSTIFEILSLSPGRELETASLIGHLHRKGLLLRISETASSASYAYRSSHGPRPPHRSRPPPADPVQRFVREPDRTLGVEKLDTTDEPLAGLEVGTGLRPTSAGPASDREGHSPDLPTSEVAEASPSGLEVPGDRQLRLAGTVGAAIVGASVLAWLLTGTNPERTPVTPPALTQVPAAATPTVAAPLEGAGAYSLSRPPPIAGPDADARLREAEQAIALRAYRQAEQILAEMREVSPDDSTVWVLSAHLDVERGRYSDARVHLDRAFELDPQHYRGHVLKGSLEQFAGNSARAIVSYRRALELQPRHVMSPELRIVAEELERAHP